MKTNTLAAGVLAAALCAAAFSLAAPAYAQGWGLMGTEHLTLTAGANNGMSGGPTYTVPTDANGGMTNSSLTVTSGGTGTNTLNGGVSDASASYDLQFQVTYVWQGPGTPTPNCSVTETDTLTANVTLSGPESATATAGVDNTNEVATAHTTPGNPYNAPSDTPPPFVRNYNMTANGGSCMFNVSVNASATGYVTTGNNFTSKGVATVAFR